MDGDTSSDDTSSSDDDSSSEQRPAVSPLLTPTDSTLKQLWLQERTSEFPFKEYRLNGTPESLKTFVDLFLLENETYRHDKNRFIWTSENCLVSVGSWWLGGLPGDYKKRRFALVFTIPFLYIHSSTVEDALSCLELLFGLHDDHFEGTRLLCPDISDDYANDAPHLCLCPLTSHLLEKMLQQNAKRKNVFICMIFTPDQCRTLATSGTSTEIEFDSCSFEDEGEAFLEALAVRADQKASLVKLTIRNYLLFAEGILVLFLHQHKLESLTLDQIQLESEETCRALAAAELQYLDLQLCKLEDGGASLVESIREGRGPKGLGLDRTDREGDWRPFDSFERFVSFANALRGNAHLERLDLSHIDIDDGTLQALAAALLENEGLIHLGLELKEQCELDKTCWCELMKAISTHSSLRTLAFGRIYSRDLDGTSATQVVADILLVNEQLEAIRIHAFFDHDDDWWPSAEWDELVTPRLECNIYRKRFPAIQNIRVPSTRAAVVARILSHVNNKSSLAFMLLRQNGDILSSYSRVESQIATSPGKRGRSPSSDGIVVSNLGP
jgi:hypothetical protein